jgi:hypothetical protein
MKRLVEVVPSPGTRSPLESSAPFKKSVHFMERSSLANHTPPVMATAQSHGLVQLTPAGVSTMEDEPLVPCIRTLPIGASMSGAAIATTFIQTGTCPCTGKGTRAHAGWIPSKAVPLASQSSWCTVIGASGPSL